MYVRAVLCLAFVLFSARGFAADSNETNTIPSNDTDVGETRPKLQNNASVVETYEKAVRSYLDEDWDACIQGFREFLFKFKKYKSTVIRCRKTCRGEVEESYPIIRENVEDLMFYERKIKEALCILKCNQQYRDVAGKSALKKIPVKQEWKFEAGAAYEYLHICYYQKKYYQEAANSVFTYLVHHPNHKASQASLSFYASMPEVDNTTIRNLEAPMFFDDYVKGVQAYEDGYYEKAVAKIEMSLSSYLETEEQCRFYCEGPFEMYWSPDFTIGLANHFVYNLRCKRRCSLNLHTINGEHRPDFFMNHYNYLQFSYYKLRNIKEACKAVASYLLFLPSDKTMLANKEYYSSLPKITEDDFEPRKEAVAYVKRQEYEKLLLLYTDKEFQNFEDKVTSETTPRETVYMQDL